MGAFDDLIPQSQNGTGAFEDLIPRADPKIGQPEELTFAERTLAPILEKLGMSAATKGGAVGRFLRGAADPAVGAVQAAANLTPAGPAVNKWVSDQEKDYQAARAVEGSEGFDALRTAGGIVATAPLVPAMAGAGVVRGAVAGAGQAALEPVKDAESLGDFWADKGKQAAVGGAVGAVASPLLGALARVVSPKASTDDAVRLLREEGVNPTVGQTLGGFFNKLEQRATSFPVVGDKIAAARRGAIEEFDKAAIARTVAPGRVTQAGHEGVKEAGDVLSSVYEQAAKNVGHINLVGTSFDNNLGQLRQMAADGLAPDLARKFDRVLEVEVLRRLSPNGSVAGSEIKKIDSALGKIAADYRKSAMAGEREFGDAVRQLQQNFRDGLAEVDPAYAAAKAKADAGWAMLKRVRKAATSAKNEEGIFTPAQLNAAVQQFDSSAGKRATAEGTALMQDLARAGQRLGTKVPDSGTAGRLGQGAAAIAAMVEPMSIAGMAGGYSLYSQPVQNVLRVLVSRRPEYAPAVANYLRSLSTPAALAGGAAAPELLQ